MPTPSTPAKVAPKEPLITPEADRALIKIMVAYGGVFVVLFLLAPLAIAYVNVKTNPLFAMHRFLDTISTLVIMFPFFLGINAMNNARLKFARRYVAEENWKGVYGSVESFSQLGQNWMDRTGEAHYLLAIAQERLGQKAEAVKSRNYVTKLRPGSEWALKLRDMEASRAPKRISELKAANPDGVRKMQKTKRRF